MASYDVTSNISGALGGYLAIYDVVSTTSARPLLPMERLPLLRLGFRRRLG